MAVTVTSAVSAVIIPVLVAVIIPTIMISFLITRNILAIVPVVVHKEDLLAAGVVFATVFTPMFGMARGDVQINRWAVSPQHPPLHDYGLTVDYAWRRVVANIKAAIEPGLAYTDRNVNVGSKYRDSDSNSGDSRGNQKTFHIVPPLVGIL
jgi:hypothetical protein